MNRKQLAALMSSACVSLVLAACIPSHRMMLNCILDAAAGAYLSPRDRRRRFTSGIPCPGILVSSRRSSSSPVVC